MNQIEVVTGLPKWKFTEHCQKEIEMTGQELVDMSDFVYRIGNAAVAGFIYSSYTSPPWMWFLLAEDITIADLVDFRRIVKKIPQGTLTAVESTFAVGLKFAKLYEFEFTGEEVEHFSKMYRIMRKI